MATAKQLSIDVLLVTVERPIPYLKLEPSYRTDGSDATVKGYFDKVKASLEGGRKDPIEGVEYQTTNRGDVGIVWIEIEDSTPEILKDGQAWLDGLGLDWAKANAGWVKQKNSSRQGYTGYSLQKK